jgi:hypothetical protein
MGRKKKNPAGEGQEPKAKTDYQAHMASWESKKEKKAKKIAPKDLKFQTNVKGE